MPSTPLPQDDAACAGTPAHGVVGLGDSYLNGYGLPLAGISCTPWTGWLAWALRTCCTQLAVNGATCEQVLHDQTPLLRRRYLLGAVWLGANDIARLDSTAFARSFRALCTRVGEACDTVAVGTLPAALTSPGASQHAHAVGRLTVNTIIRGVAADVGAVLVELEDALDGRWSMAPDREHPTSLGQLTAATVAAAALDARGMHFLRHLPSAAERQPTPAERLLYRPSRRSRLRLRGAGW